MSKHRVYLLDSDVFIAAKNAYDAFPICPGFWDSLIHHHNAGSVFSIDKVPIHLFNLGELAAGGGGEINPGGRGKPLGEWIYRIVLQSVA